MEIIGFRGGIPKEVKETWRKEQNGRKCTFGKDRKAPKHFIYYCQRSISDGTVTQDSSTGFETDRDLTHDEVEKWPQFVKFMAARIPLHLGDQVRQIATGRVGKFEEHRPDAGLFRVFFSDGKEPLLNLLQRRGIGIGFMSSR
jgi:hypothetical protein